MESTNLSKIKREKMLAALAELKSNTTDENMLVNLSLIENELTKKKYGLVWEEHQEKVDTELETQVPTFEEVKEKEIVCNENEQYNFLLEGDNLHSLYLLEKTHAGKIDLIYIDPPYNTGKKDFVYNDKFVDKEDGYKHSKWLSYMQKRLLICKQLMTSNGFIFISIDDNELSQLKLLCDNVFGESNFISVLSIENNPKGRKNSNFVSVSNEYCLIYSNNKNNSYFLENIPKNKKDLSLDSKGNFIHNSGKRVLVGENAFNETNTIFSSDKHYSVYYNREIDDFLLLKENDLNDINNGLINSGYKRYVSYYKDSFVYNTYTIEKLQKLFDDDLLDIKEDKIYEKNPSTTIRIKSIIRNLKYDAVINNAIIKDYEIDVKTTSANKMLKEIFNTTKPIFNNPKNIGLLKLLISLIDNKNATILDFFAGSGTTGHAVLALNKEDGGNRKFILCTNNENNICEEITYKRLQNVVNGYGNVDGIPANLKYYKTAYVPKLNSDEENLYNNLLKNVRNLIQLENGIKIDDKKIRVFFDETGLDNFAIKEQELVDCDMLYISSDILLTAEQEELLQEHNINVCVIPEYYFEKEIMEVE